MRLAWGRDLRWNPTSHRWTADLGSSKDNGWKRGLKVKPVEQLLHIYRVLATRGMKGAHFYFLDDATRDRFLSLLPA